IALDHVEGLDDETVWKLMRGNAIRMLDLDLDRTPEQYRARTR
ncbi:amidohydrolase, partial [Streptomyces sp. SB3404]|nr:amidohydrolase [Streptomyces boncukensis]